MENYTDGTGQKVRVHDIAVCSAVQRNRGSCVIHKRKDTHMKDWPTHWRTRSGGFFEVLCPHGIGHPAPEETRTGVGIHGCDGCCSTPPQSPTDGTGSLGPGFGYRQGGLMRCCLLTMVKVYEDDPTHVPFEGDKLPCRSCSSTMVFRQGAWEWDKSRANPTGVVIPPDAELAA
jgi:hypothetical protein